MSAARIVAFAAIAMLPIAAAPADDIAAWKTEREGRFAAVKAAHPPQDKVIAEIKAKTAAQVAAYTPPPSAALDAPPMVWRTQSEPVVVFDIPVAPRMVVVPAGEFTMGSLATEAGHSSNEAPRRRIRIDHAFAVSMFPVTYGEYAYFAGTTGHKSAASCAAPDGQTTTRRDWHEPGFAQTPRSPATCIGFSDALAYAAWLSAETGQKYRLLSDAEYEYANRAGTATAYWWGDNRAAGCKLVNGLDTADCDDGFAFTMPLDKSKPNPFGLFDIAGNVASWTSDCWRATAVRIPMGGETNAAENCRSRVVRGGSWASPAADLRSAARVRASNTEARTDRGFRVARDL